MHSDVFRLLMTNTVLRHSLSSVSKKKDMGFNPMSSFPLTRTLAGCHSIVANLHFGNFLNLVSSHAIVYHLRQPADSSTNSSTDRTLGCVCSDHQLRAFSPRPGDDEERHRRQLETLPVSRMPVLRRHSDSILWPFRSQV